MFMGVRAGFQCAKVEIIISSLFYYVAHMDMDGIFRYNLSRIHAHLFSRELEKFHQVLGNGHKLLVN